MTRVTLAILVAAASLSGCATRGPTSVDAPDAAASQVPSLAVPLDPPANAHQGPGPAPFTSRVVQVDVTVGLEVVSSGLGYWLDHGVVLTSLHAVNTVPPDGGLVVRADGQSFNASTWAGGNRTDLDAAILYVHNGDKQGALPALVEPCAEGVAPTPDDVLLTPSSSIAIPTTMHPQLSGAAVYSPSGDCRLGVLNPDPSDPTRPRVTPISAQAILEKALPED
jgi:hypothetical protein